MAAFTWWLRASAAPRGTDTSAHTEATDVSIETMQGELEKANTAAQCWRAGVSTEV